MVLADCFIRGSFIRSVNKQRRRLNRRVLTCSDAAPLGASRSRRRLLITVTPTHSNANGSLKLIAQMQWVCNHY